MARFEAKITAVVELFNDSIEADSPEEAVQKFKKILMDGTYLRDTKWELDHQEVEDCELWIPDGDEEVLFSVSDLLEDEAYIQSFNSEDDDFEDEDEDEG